MKKTIAIALLLAVLAGLYACGEGGAGSSAPVSTAESGPESAPVESSRPEETTSDCPSSQPEESVEPYDPGLDEEGTDIIDMYTDSEVFISDFWLYFFDEAAYENEAARYAAMKKKWDGIVKKYKGKKGRLPFSYYMMKEMKAAPEDMRAANEAAKLRGRGYFKPEILESLCGGDEEAIKQAFCAPLAYYSAKDKRVYSLFYLYNCGKKELRRIFGEPEMTEEYVYYNKELGSYFQRVRKRLLGGDDFPEVYGYDWEWVMYDIWPYLMMVTEIYYGNVETNKKYMES